MNIREIVLCSILASLEFIAFTSFSFWLYLEAITLTICVIAMAFSLKEAMISAFLFGVINLFVQGVNPWNMIYVFLYPAYTFVIGKNKVWLEKRKWAQVVLCGFFSFLTGQILQLPFILFSKQITLLYLLMGLKVSLPQGFLSGMAYGWIGHRLIDLLKQVRRRFI